MNDNSSDDKIKIRELLPARPEEGNKYTFGHLLIIAGSRGMTGAALLSAKAALKSGAGLVTVACPDTERPIIASAFPEIITYGIVSKKGCFCTESVKEILELIKKKHFNSLLIGPGLSCENETINFVIEILNNVSLPAVIDADALNAVAKYGSFPFCINCRIITPHEGEAARLLEIEKITEREQSVSDLALMCNGVAILKGHNTLISDSVFTTRDSIGGSELAKGGSGDVLAGLCAGLYTQKGLMEGFNAKIAFESAVLAVYIHSLSGKFASEKYTKRCVTATDIINAIPEAFLELENTDDDENEYEDKDENE